MFPYVSIDIETTSLNEDNGDIIEFGAILDNLSDPYPEPIDELKSFHCYFLPPEGNKFTGEPYALSMHSQIFRRIAERTPPYKYVSPFRFGNMFKLFLLENGYEAERDVVTITVAGKNFASFDLQFLKRKTDLLKHVNIRHRIIDPSILYISPVDEVVPSTEECMRRMGCSSFESSSHNAIDDAKDIVALVRYRLGGIFEGDIPF